MKAHKSVMSDSILWVALCGCVPDQGGKFMNLSIAICDDELDVCSELEVLLSDVAKKFKFKCDIDVHYSNVHLFKEMDARTHYDLIFLDIQFKDDDLNGVEVGNRIRDVHKNNAVEIVYISWETRYCEELFNVRPLNFIKKPITSKIVEQVVSKYIELYRVRRSYFVYKIGHEEHKVALRDIKYVESYDKKLVLHFASGNKTEFYGSLRNVYTEQLEGKDFLYIHANYAVNYDYIVKYARKEIFLMDMRSPFSISHDRQTPIKKAYAEITARREMD